MDRTISASPNPLSAAVFQILLALADSDRHGYAISQEVAERTEGAVRLSPGTLYTNLQRMLEEGFIVELTRRPPGAKNDPRRRYYRLTRLGLKAAEAELARLEGLVRQARSFKLRARKS
jgi:DNA-binding PadR family transcriptional regulator